MAEEQVPLQMQLTEQEKDWIKRRKSGDLTPRQHLLVTELQTRASIYNTVPEGKSRDDLLAQSLKLQHEIAALDMETASMTVLNGINDRLTRLAIGALGSGKP